jgi:Putative transposase, YhgA-like
MGEADAGSGVRALRDMAPHDPLFKSLLRAFFAGFLRLVAPDLAARLDLSAVAFLDKEFVSAAPPRTRGIADLLARAPLTGTDRFLLVHVEIESRARRGMGARLRDYHRAIQARHEEPVLSIVVYLKGGPAGICEQELDGGLKAPGLTSFRYLSFGLSRCSAEEYLASPEPLAWALAALMKRGGLSKVELKMRCFARLTEATLKDEERRELANCIETYLELTPEEVEEISLLDTSQAGRTQAMSLLYKVSWADKMMLEGERRGIRDVLFDDLEERFGPVPQEIRSRIESIQSVDRLKRLIRKARIAKSLKGLRLG